MITLTKRYFKITSFLWQNNNNNNHNQTKNTSWYFCNVEITIFCKSYFRIWFQPLSRFHHSIQSSYTFNSFAKERRIKKTQQSHKNGHPSDAQLCFSFSIDSSHNIQAFFFCYFFSSKVFKRTEIHISRRVNQKTSLFKVKQWEQHANKNNKTSDI